MTTEQWERENQDTLMEYFIDGDPSVRRIQCEYCRKVIYTQTRNRKYCSFQTCGHKMLNLKLTRHNGRAGTHGTYNPKHNDRSFNLANSEHIDPERAKGNIYWDCFHGFRSALDPQDPDDLGATFSDVERQFYESRYSNFVESQNERNAKIRHTERNRSIPDLLSSRKTYRETEGAGAAHLRH